MDKELFGSFIAEQRKAKGMTQKELADSLLISDKAVSKWERGLSFPDITLLEPLAQLLSVSITELMKGRKIDMEESFKAKDVEKAVQDTIEMNEVERKEAAGRSLALRIIAVISFSLLAALECVFVCMKCDFERVGTFLITPVGLCVSFGIYMWLFTKDKLPAYYDENRISQYSDGFFRMNVPGVYFNNSNWKHIVHAMRVWLAVTAIAFPALVYLEETFFAINSIVLMLITLIIVFATIFIPIYVQGRKYM